MTNAKITFFVADLAANPIVRAAPIAEALQSAGYNIEVIGPLISGREIYRPYQGRFEYIAVPAEEGLRQALLKLSRAATGHVIYACKPIVGSFLPALLASRFGTTRPLLLDVEDDELWLDDQLLTRVRWWRAFDRFRKLRHTYALHPLTKLVQNVTVVSTALQRRYGGTIVLHGPDERIFDPTKYDGERAAVRRHYGLPQRDIVLLFAGIPQRHKGLDLIIEALKNPRLRSMHLALAGPPENEAFRQAAHLLPKQVSLIGLVPYAEMPRLLATCDIVPTPQRENQFTISQVPAKLLEGMAMGKTVIGSRVSDIPQILGEGSALQRGWLHRPGDVAELASCLVEVQSSPDEVARRARNARAWYAENASTRAIASRVVPIVEGALSQRMPAHRRRALHEKPRALP